MNRIWDPARAQRRRRHQDLLDRALPEVARRLGRPKLTLILAEDDGKVTAEMPGWHHTFDLSEQFEDYDPAEGLGPLENKLVEIIEGELARRPPP